MLSYFVAVDKVRVVLRVSGLHTVAIDVASYDLGRNQAQLVEMIEQIASYMNAQERATKEIVDKLDRLLEVTLNDHGGKNTGVSRSNTIINEALTLLGYKDVDEFFTRRAKSASVHK